MDFHQRGQPGGAGQRVQLLQLPGRQDARDQQNGVRARLNRFQNLPAINDKILAQQRNFDVPAPVWSRQGIGRIKYGGHNPRRGIDVPIFSIGQPLDLNIAKCRMMVAVRNDFDYESAVKQGARLRVATKYVKTAREHFAAKGVHVDLIKLYGSMELAPLVGLSDAIVDLVSSGATLKANNLKAVEEIAPISSRLIVNQASLKLKRALIQPMLDAFAGAVK